MNTARSEEGATMVETALSAMVLFMIIFGIMQVSLALYSYHFLAEAARLGTRYAMVRGSSCQSGGNFGSACPASAADVQSYIRGLAFPGINSSSINVTTAWSANGTACSPSASCNNPGNAVQVKVQYQVLFAIPLVPRQSYTLSSTSKMVIAN